MAQRRLPVVIGLLAVLALPRAGHAGAVEDLLAAARESLQEGRYNDVAAYVRRAEKVAPNADEPIPAVVQARIWYYAGLAEWLGGNRNDALDPWRVALSIEPRFEWEADSFTDDEGETVFESLRREVRSRPTLDLGVPADTGAARIFVAGHRVDPTSRVVEGRYLVQAACGDGAVYGRWWKFGKPPNYESLCPDGFGQVAEPAVADGEILFDDFGNPILPGGDPVPAPADPAPPPKDPAPADPAPPPKDPAPPPKARQAASPRKADPAPPADPAPADAPAAVPPETPPPPPTVVVEAVLPTEPRVPREGPGAGMGLVFGGAGLLAVGTATNFLLVNPAWAAVEAARQDPSGVTRDEADDLTGRFNTWRAVTLGVLGAGVVSVSGGLLLETAHFGVTPGGFYLEGSF